MRTITAIFTWTLFSFILFGQNEKQYYDDFLHRQFGTTLIDKGDFHDTIFENDFSDIWNVKKLNLDPSNYPTIRQEPLGYIGENFQRLFIHFSEVKKESDRKYHVRGKSMVKNNICNFEGHFTIKLAREFEIPYIDGAYYTIDPRTITQGVLIGIYELFEDSTQNHSGKFNGNFIISFLITETGRLEYNITAFFSDNYINNQFKGTWKPYNSNNLKTANWGDWRIPESGDLDIGAGEFSPSSKYLKFGWQSYSDAFFSSEPNEKAVEQEKLKWWE
jgi:hypothetical protein